MKGRKSITELSEAASRKLERKPQKQNKLRQSVNVNNLKHRELA